MHFHLDLYLVGQTRAEHHRNATWPATSGGAQAPRARAGAAGGSADPGEWERGEEAGLREQRQRLFCIWWGGVHKRWSGPFGAHVDTDRAFEASQCRCPSRGGIFSPTP